MFSMITLKHEPLEDMTWVFIVVTVANFAIFALQTVCGFVFESFEKCKKNG
jgi:hypothetical protein